MAVFIVIKVQKIKYFLMPTVLYFAIGCSNISDKVKAEESMRCLETLGVKFNVSYKISESVDRDIYSVIVTASKKYNGMDLQEVAFTKEHYPFLVVPLSNIAIQDSSSVSYVFFASREFLNGDYCLRAGYAKKDVLTGVITDVDSIYRIVNID